MSEDWGTWIEHDGKGCPVVGLLVIAQTADGETERLVAGSECVARGLDPNDWRSAWVWLHSAGPLPSEIIRYRVRQPRAMRDLRRLAEAPRAPEAVPA